MSLIFQGSLCQNSSGTVSLYVMQKEQLQIRNSFFCPPNQFGATVSSVSARECSCTCVKIRTFGLDLKGCLLKKIFVY